MLVSGSQHGSMLTGLKGSTSKDAAPWAMVERLADSSSSEYLNLLDEEEGEMAEDGVPGEPLHPTRVIRDRLGQVVREPPGPPPGYEERTRRQAEAEREIYDSGSEEEEGDEAIRAPDAPLGPPPPNPTYLQEVQSISLQLSAQVAQTMGLTEGQVLTVVPPYWRDIHRVRVDIRGMVPSDVFHPHVMHLADDRPPGLAALENPNGPQGPEGPSIPPPSRTEPRTPGAPCRRRRSSRLANDDIEETTDGGEQQGPAEPGLQAETDNSSTAAAHGAEATRTDRPVPDLTVPSSSAGTAPARLSPREIDEAIADLEIRTMIEELAEEDVDGGPQSTLDGPEMAVSDTGAETDGPTAAGVTSSMPASATSTTFGDPNRTTFSMASSSRPPPTTSHTSPSSRTNRKPCPHLWGLKFLRLATLGLLWREPPRLSTAHVCQGAICQTRRSERALYQLWAHGPLEALQSLGRGRLRKLPKQNRVMMGQTKERPRDGFDHGTTCSFETSSAQAGKRHLMPCSSCSCTLTCSFSAMYWLARYRTRRTLRFKPVALLCSWAICVWRCATAFLFCRRPVRPMQKVRQRHTNVSASTTSPYVGMDAQLESVPHCAPGQDPTPQPRQPVRALQAGSNTKVRKTRSRLGPKSQGCCSTTASHLHPGRRVFLWCLLIVIISTRIQSVAAAVDARVGFTDHRLNPRAKPFDTHVTEGAKHGEYRHSARTTSTHPHREIVRKRALQRAINRADRNPQGQTWYRGKLLHRTQLGSGYHGHGLPPRRQAVPTNRTARRIRLVSWNAGGLMDTRYQEVLAWLEAEAQAGRPVDILTLQETCWKQDMEYRTSCGTTDEAYQAYHVVHSTGGDKSGIMIMVRQGLLPAHSIQYVPLVPGRVVHLRLRFPTPLDILCMYQVSWNVAKSTLEGHKVTALLKQRARIWRHLEQWLRTIPGRHGCLIVGDLNTPLNPEPGVCGPVPVVQHIAQQDQAELQAILRTFSCCALNSWTGTGAQARTFIPPTGDQASQGTRIDFVIARGGLIDNEAKKAGVISAPFVPTSGARHRPVQAKIRLPTIPKPGLRPPPGRQPAQVCKQLRDPQMEAGLARNLSVLLDQSTPETDIDDVLLKGWEITRHELPDQHRRRDVVPQQGLAVRHRIQHMWQIRASLRCNQLHAAGEGDLPSLASIWRAWIQVARLQACTRQLRRDCRQHKTLKIYEAVHADNIYAAAKKFAPRQARRRLQLRTKDGQLMAHEQEFQSIKTYFTELYHGPYPQEITLSQEVQFEPAEVRVAILKLAAGKAMPQQSAPAALWRTSVDQVAYRLCLQLNTCLKPGCNSLPERWSTSDMALIPKPGKAMTSPEQLRPISLLPMPAKALGSMIAERLHEHAYRYLQDIPQYAYMKGRHLGMALDRVASHCISVRRLLQDQANTLHARRSGRKAAQVCGGCMLSLDLSKAYDHVPWDDLAEALRDAEVPTRLVELILLLHQQARIRISHHDQSELLRMFRGLRQGCSLAPALWTIYSGWLLKGLHATGDVDITASNTSYADDFHFCWQVLQASDMERSYRAMRTVLQGLEERHVQVNLDKTVAIIDLQGPGAKKCLDRYLVRRPRHEGLFLKFMIAGEARYVQVKPSHTYLGVSISYKKPEQETAKLRLDLATGAFRRLKKILTCRDVPLKLRLQLWQGTVLPTMLHGIDSVGLPLKEANQIMIAYFKQVRSVAKSFSMFTHETNQDLAKRLGLVDPLQRLSQALERRSRASTDLPEPLLPGPVQQQWRLFVRSQLAEARDACGTRTGPRTQQQTSLVLVQDILHEQHECMVCGQMLATSAALKRHMFRQHLDEDTQLATIQENRRKLRGNELVHAQSGMPQCRHCQYKFTTWHAFFYHINTRGCPVLRALHEKGSNAIVTESLNEAVVNDAELLQMTKSCTWRDIAMHPKVRAKHQHCPECHMWTVRHQYIKRHMLQKHPEQTAIIEQSEKLIVRSDLSIGNPCIYCGLSYTRKAAHLKSCIGLFNGVYLYLRIARGPILTELSGQHGYGYGGRQEQTSVGRGHPRAGPPGRLCTEGGPTAGNALHPTGPPGDGSSQARAGDGQGGQGGHEPSAAEVPQGRRQGQPRPPRTAGQGSRARTKSELATTRCNIKQLLARTPRSRSPGTTEIQSGGTKGPLERGGAGSVRAGGVPSHHQDLDHADVTPRGPVCDSEARHGVCCVYPNWIPREHSSVP